MRCPPAAASRPEETRRGITSVSESCLVERRSRGLCSLRAEPADLPAGFSSFVRPCPWGLWAGRAATVRWARRRWKATCRAVSTSQAATLPLVWAIPGASFHSRRKTSCNALSASGLADKIRISSPISLGANSSYKLSSASTSRSATRPRSSSVFNSLFAPDDLEDPALASVGMTFQSTQISNPFPGELSHSVFPVPQGQAGFVSIRSQNVRSVWPLPSQRFFNDNHKENRLDYSRPPALNNR